MAAGHISLAELATINNRNLSGAITDELLEGAPVFMQLFSQIASQSNVHQYLQYDDPPPVGFRVLNDGREDGHSSDNNVTIPLSILDASFTIDEAAGTGHIGGTSALLAREGMRSLRTAFAKAERQVFYGTSALGDASGFEGLANNGGLDGLADDMVLGAGGSTADSQTSVYLLRTDFNNISVVTGNNGDISMGESRLQKIQGSTTGTLAGWFTPCHAWYALQQGGKYSAGRVANVETSLTDDMIAEAISLFPADRQPNLIAMNRKAAKLLRESRTATNPSGQPAPFVENCFGVPVVVTDQIQNTEAVVA